MKKKTLSKKLVLNHETLRNLDGDRLENVAGQWALSNPCRLTEVECTTNCSGAFPC